MRLPTPGFLIQALAQVLRRFPATMLCAVGTVISLSILVEDHSSPGNLVRTVLVCLLGLPLLTGLVAFSDSKGWNDKQGLLLQGVGLIALVGYWFLIDPKSKGFEYREAPGYLALILVSHLFVAVAPYLNSRSVRDFWEYNKDLFATIIVGLAFSLILFAGLSLAILAVDQLFTIHVDDKIYVRLFFILMGIFNTAYFLFHFPKEYVYGAEENSYNVVFINLCKYILITIVGIYFLILYAYSFKIIATWTLPKGWVSSLVAGFSVAGIFTYLLNFYLPEQDSSFQVRAYRRWFWWILLPLTALLFAAIGRRIGDYGVTEMRFLVAQMGVWLALNCLYFLFSKKDNIKFIPVSLAIFALSWAFGPFSAKAVSERSQLSKITQILQQSGRMEGGKMKPADTPVTEMESDDFESAVYFLERRDRLALLRPMLPKPVDSLPDAPGYYGASGKLRAWLGMGTTPKESTDQKRVNVYSPTPINAVDIRGFATFKPLALNKSSKAVAQSKGDYFQLSEDGKSLEWWTFDGKDKKTMRESFDLQPIMKKWKDLRQEGSSYYELSATEQSTDIIRPKGTIRLIVETGMAEMSTSGFSMGYLNGFVFLK